MKEYGVSQNDDDDTFLSDKPEQKSAGHDTHAPLTRVFVILPYLGAKALRGAAHVPSRSVSARLEEAEGLARAINVNVCGSLQVSVNEVRPATYLGKGKVEEIAEILEREAIDLAFVDTALSPVQQRNLEKAFNCKVLDRTGLILEIFGERARTREGRLQVELAHLSYQKSRLVRSWTHLERQRGGFGFLGGPGETQIEADRRMIQDRISRLKVELEGVKQTRKLHRTSRAKVPYPIVALVGYTNAGKSTLFNKLTKADVFAQDLLFATLDPTLRILKLPQGSKVILSDTVGFISDLPTHLIAAFRATLEEVLVADVILHVRDISHPDSDAQSLDVARVLQDLGINSEEDPRLIEVWNKADLLDESGHMQMDNQLARASQVRRPFLVSALNGEGLEHLSQAIEKQVGHSKTLMTLRIPAEDGAGQHWVHEYFEVVERFFDDAGDVILRVRVPPDRVDEMARRYALVPSDQSAEFEESF